MHYPAVLLKRIFLFLAILLAAQFDAKEGTKAVGANPPLKKGDLTATLATISRYL